MHVNYRCARSYVRVKQFLERLSSFKTIENIQFSIVEKN